MKIYNLQSHKHVRQTLRRKTTPAEVILWDELKGYRLDGYKFRRQHGIGRYIVDFFCPELRLIIELDGSIHDLPSVKEQDIVREQTLMATGLQILRFTNTQIEQDLVQVISKIRDTCHTQSLKPV